MREKLRNRLLKYGHSATVCVGMVLLYCLTHNYHQLKPLEKYRVLCDAFTVPGLLALCAGVLIWVSNEGFFCGLSYCLYVAWQALIPGARCKIKRYYDYVTSQKEKQIAGYGFLFLIGGVCMAISLVFMNLSC